MLKKAWEYRQDASWYFFMEADTAVSWKNLRTFLDQLDPNDSLYLGSPTKTDIEFAHGGTGYVISGAAMKEAIGSNPSLQKMYGPEVSHICCGDRMPAKILLDKGIGLSRTWPMFNGEKPATLAFGFEQWCQPVITMHHLTSHEISSFWNFEQAWKSSGVNRPVLWMDVYNRFVHPHLQQEKRDWVNWAADMVYDGGKEDLRRWPRGSLELASVSSSENCKHLCQEDRNCLSWEYHDQTCSTARTFRLGQAKTGIAKATWTSG